MSLCFLCGIFRLSLSFTLPDEARERRPRGEQEAPEIPVLVVDSPPPGVNLTGCIVDRETGHCCIDKVDEVSSPVTDPVLECLTHYEETCHTSYVTEYVSKQDKVSVSETPQPRTWSLQDCKSEFEKKCRIVIEKKEYNETVSSCLRPLQRVCPTEDGGSVVERIRRNTDNKLEQLADQLDDTPPPVESRAGGEGEDTECQLYHETLCTGQQQLSLSAVLGPDCERVPVRLCADTCQVREGPVTCRDLQLLAVREEPEEHCQIIPQKTCRSLTWEVSSVFNKKFPLQDCETPPPGAGPSESVYCQP